MRLAVLCRRGSLELVVQKKGVSCNSFRRFSALALVEETTRQPVPWLLIAELAVGLPAILYTFKSASLVLFQRKLIYLHYLPPGARRETLSEYRSSLDVDLRADAVTVISDHHIKLQGVLLVYSEARDPDIILLHCQGNAGTPLHRLTIFQRLFRALKATPLYQRTAVICVAPRSYWTSTPGRLSENAIVADYIATLRYVTERYPRAKIVLHGHSLGAAAAAQVFALSRSTRVAGVVLEAAILSIPDMVSAIYPQRWLPYRYLGVFALDKFWTAQAVARFPADVPLLVIRCERDELVPPSMSDEIFRRANSRDKNIAVIHSALHQNAYLRKGWAEALIAFLQKVDAHNNQC